MMITKTKNQISWRGTFSYNNSNTFSLKGTDWLFDIGNNKSAWLVVGGFEPIPYSYNGETLKGRSVNYRVLEFRRAK